MTIVKLWHRKVLRAVFFLTIFIIVAVSDWLIAAALRAQISDSTDSKLTFTSAQITRGRTVYLDECARCHTPDLLGGDFGPALLGAEFVNMWSGKTVGDLFRRVVRTMPLDNPGVLSTQQGTDIVAYLLKSNDFPTGNAALKADVGVLNTITIPREMPR